MDTRKKYLLQIVLSMFLFSFICVPSFGGDELSINIKESKEIFVRSVTKKDRGILLITHNLNSRSFFFNFIGTDLVSKWKVEVDKETLGFLNTMLDGRYLDIFFVSDFVYILHEGHESYYQSDVYVIQIDKSGTMKSNRLQEDKNTSFDFYFVLDDRIRIKCSDPKARSSDPADFITEIDPADLKARRTHDFTLPKSIQNWIVSEHDQGIFYYYGTIVNPADEKMEEVVIIETDEYGDVVKANSYIVAKDAALLADKKFTITDSYFYGDFENERYYVPALICHGASDFYKDGFVLSRFSREGKQEMSTLFWFSKLSQYKKMSSRVEKGYISSNFRLISEKNDMMLTMWPSLQEKKGSVSFLMTGEGKIKLAFFSKYQSQTSAKNTFSVSHNGESDHHMSKFYTQYFREPKVAEEFAAAKKLVRKRHTEPKEKYSINIDDLGNGVQLITDYNESTRVITYNALAQ